MPAKINDPRAYELENKYFRSVKQEFEAHLDQVPNEHIRECLRLLWEETHQPSNDWLPTHGVDYGD